MSGCRSTALRVDLRHAQVEYTLPVSFSVSPPLSGEALRIGMFIAYLNTLRNKRKKLQRLPMRKALRLTKLITELIPNP